MADNVSHTSKKLLNSTELSAWEGLNGLVSWNTGLAFMPGHRDVVLRRDWEDVKKAGKVSIITGGGSGHEPMWAGYVGEGMLTAAVHGDVFAAPSAKSIFATLLHLGKENPAGVLVLFCNYTGDRLNFGTAVEKARLRGVHVEAVTFADDCALESGWKEINRRGLAGFSLLLKVVGHMANTGAPLDKLTAFAKKTVTDISTMGVAWASCSLPGAGLLFQMEDDKMELGLGIHGEAGMKRVKMDTTSNTVKAILTQILNKKVDPPLNSIKKGDKVVVLLNNLGATTDIEMSVLAKEVVLQLGSNHSLVVERLMVGRYVTSLEMAGISISVMLTDDFKNAAIDAPTSAQGWLTPCTLKSGSGQSMNSHLERVAKEMSDVANAPLKGESSKVSAVKGPDLTEAGHQLMQKCMTSVANNLVANKDLLNAWDAVTGDGDCGNTLASAAKGIYWLLSEKRFDGIMNVCQILEILANTLEDYMGGTSGGIYSLMLASMSQHLAAQPAGDVDRKAWVGALRRGVQTIIKYGGAEPGSRTMVDPLNAVVEALEGAKDKGVVESWQIAAKAAEEATKATLGMRALAGRAVYVNSSLLVHPDPGAKAVSVWVAAIVSTMVDNKKLLD